MKTIVLVIVLGLTARLALGDIAVIHPDGRAGALYQDKGEVRYKECLPSVLDIDRRCVSDPNRADFTSITVADYLNHLALQADLPEGFRDLGAFERVSVRINRIEAELSGESALSAEQRDQAKATRDDLKKKQLRLLTIKHRVLDYLIEGTHLVVDGAFEVAKYHELMLGFRPQYTFPDKAGETPKYHIYFQAAGIRKNTRECGEGWQLISNREAIETEVFDRFRSKLTDSLSYQNDHPVIDREEIDYYGPTYTNVWVVNYGRKVASRLIWIVDGDFLAEDGSSLQESVCDDREYNNLSWVDREAQGSRYRGEGPPKVSPRCHSSAVQSDYKTTAAILCIRKVGGEPLPLWKDFGEKP